MDADADADEYTVEYADADADEYKDADADEYKDEDADEDANAAVVLGIEVDVSCLRRRPLSLGCSFSVPTFWAFIPFNRIFRTWRRISWNWLWLWWSLD